MLVEDPAKCGGAQERRPGRANEAQGAGQKAQGENEGHLHCLLSLSPEPYAFGHEIPCAVERDERSLASGGKATPLKPREISFLRGVDALMVNQGVLNALELRRRWPRYPVPHGILGHTP